MRLPQLIKRWPTAIGCFIFHTLGVFYVLWLYSGSKDPNAPMIWLYPIGFDWPLSLILAYSSIRTTLGITLSLLLLGGLQWTVLGGLFDIFLRFRRHDAPQSPARQ
jgi:hypothetical protein